MPTIAITVTGKVQGVWFRASTRKQALELGVSGTVCNQSDGSVYIEAQGTLEQLNALVHWCKEGPPHARVDDVTTSALLNKSFTAFTVLR